MNYLVKSVGDIAYVILAYINLCHQRGWRWKLPDVFDSHAASLSNEVAGRFSQSSVDFPGDKKIYSRVQWISVDFPRDK